MHPDWARSLRDQCRMPQTWPSTLSNGVSGHQPRMLVSVIRPEGETHTFRVGQNIGTFGGAVPLASRCAALARRSPVAYSMAGNGINFLIARPHDPRRPAGHHHLAQRRRGTGGESKLARLLGWDYSTLWRKLTGKSPITQSPTSGDPAGCGDGRSSIAGDAIASRRVFRHRLPT